MAQQQVNEMSSQQDVVQLSAQLQDLRQRVRQRVNAVRSRSGVNLPRLFEGLQTTSGAQQGPILQRVQQALGGQWVIQQRIENMRARARGLTRAPAPAPAEPSLTIAEIGKMERDSQEKRMREWRAALEEERARQKASSEALSTQARVTQV